ncbi:MULTISPECIES: hypothetical protein [unclassified Nodularia (in: cyanobacteria)]|uniref:hypothetical protein n=1 Tax=unclassified Nodularia (in: cyanobacteria) TaxID=2656917 RepID=UPI00187FA03A|nr:MULTISPECIES: hypothetical protein [unclassified Nodularia (in: cyanobacteria)]MBE9198696.1 hypothetical protein [Nodularia sp. LEGE 06071]MCC2694588.1 hypothetical protein [Nodularia sp. LEGE 04288]
MTSEREAIIFIHGFYLGRDRNYFLDYLSTGFTDILEPYRIEEAGEEKIAGYIGKTIKLVTNKDNFKKIDVYDAYWNDLVNNQLSNRNLKDRLLRGIDMLFYWFFTKKLTILTSCPPLLIGLGISLLLGIFWFYGIIALTFIALGQEPNSLGFPISEEWAKQISSFGKQMTNFTAWTLVSGFFSFVPINLMVDVAEFSTRYLKENSEGRIMRAKIRKQVSGTLNAVLETGYYNKVTILAHSFGVVIATDLLADYQQEHRIRYVSMGGCLKFLSYKSNQIEKKIRKCINNEQIETWIDFYSNQDWLSTKTFIPKDSNSEKICHREIKLPFSLLKQITGKSHDHYFTDEEVLKTVLNIENHKSDVEAT